MNGPLMQLQACSPYFLFVVCCCIHASNSNVRSCLPWQTLVHRSCHVPKHFRLTPRCVDKQPGGMILNACPFRFNSNLCSVARSYEHEMLPTVLLLIPN